MFDKVRHLLATQLEIPEDSITVETRMVELAVVDSLDWTVLILSFEDEFDVSLPDHPKCGPKTTVGDVVRWLDD